jgi:hypothetical protein
VQSFINQVINDILPTLDDPDPFLTLLGTLSILYNRIKFKKIVNQMNQAGLLPIKMVDKYFNERIVIQFHELLHLPPEIVTYESNEDRLAHIISLSFFQLMNIFLESYSYPASASKITME